ncbi:MAG: tRNA (adenosine(37)-N6)-threonylcarbamoyltransferase complex transferase subunit TsaD [Pseudomonadota bacterium]
MREALVVLGIESSCDETAAAVVTEGEPGARILSNVVLDQHVLHQSFGGIVPEIAARAHAERIDYAVATALGEADCTFRELDAIAVTSGPGLIGGLLAGVMCARGLAAGSGLPVLGINHLAGHALTPRLTDDVGFPYVMLLVSGGHCQLLEVQGTDNFVRLGSTIDDAPGEAFDKTARILGLGQPGGPAVEAEAYLGDPSRFSLPRPLLDRPGCDMSFSGLKTAVVRERDRLVAAAGGLRRQDRADLCAGFQSAVADVLSEKTRRALRAADQISHVSPILAVAGGVAANACIREALETVATEAGARFLSPPLKLCTDNAAMIGWAGIERLRTGASNGSDMVARPRWPLDAGAAAILGSGKKGAKA